MSANALPPIRRCTDSRINESLFSIVGSDAGASAASPSGWRMAGSAAATGAGASIVGAAAGGAGGGGGANQVRKERASAHAMAPIAATASQGLKLRAGRMYGRSSSRTDQ